MAQWLHHLSRSNTSKFGLLKHHISPGARRQQNSLCALNNSIKSLLVLFEHDMCRHHPERLEVIIAGHHQLSVINRGPAFAASPSEGSGHWLRLIHSHGNVTSAHSSLQLGLLIAGYHQLPAISRGQAVAAPSGERTGHWLRLIHKG